MECDEASPFCRLGALGIVQLTAPRLSQPVHKQLRTRKTISLQISGANSLGSSFAAPASQIPAASPSLSVVFFSSVLDTHAVCVALRAGVWKVPPGRKPRRSLVSPCLFTFSWERGPVPPFVQGQEMVAAHILSSLLVPHSGRARSFGATPVSWSQVEVVFSSFFR